MGAIRPVATAVFLAPIAVGGGLAVVVLAMTWAIAIGLGSRDRTGRGQKRERTDHCHSHWEPGGARCTNHAIGNPAVLFDLTLRHAEGSSHLGRWAHSLLTPPSLSFPTSGFGARRIDLLWPIVGGRYGGSSRRRSHIGSARKLLLYSGICTRMALRRSTISTVIGFSLLRTRPT